MKNRLAMHLIGLLLALLVAATAAGCGDDQLPPPVADAPVSGDHGPVDGPVSDLDTSGDLPGDSAPGDVTLCGGKSCDDKLACTEDLCVATGCLNKIKTGFCLIDGTCYKDATPAASGSCKRCDTKTATKAWTDDVSLCTDDGLSCTTASCQAGLCTNTLQTGYCLVSGACVMNGATDPTNDCLQCDIVVSTSSYQSKADGTACADDKLKCTDDKCKSGSCGHTLKAGYCKIGGTCYLDAELNPMHDCQVCTTSKATTDWSVRPDGSKCTDDGLSCTNDVCTSGNCKNVIKTGSCVISGTCQSSGQINPASECQRCDPKISSTSWSNKADGTGCTADSLSCTSDLCASGSCAHTLKSGNCLVAGACYKAGAKQPNKDCRGCNPATSTSTWSLLPDGSSCGADLYSCTNDVCKSGSCTHALLAGQCLIGGTCYKSGQGHPSVDCLACDGKTSASSWSPAVDGTACKADSYSCTSDVCKSGSCTHYLAPKRCLIQSNCFSTGDKHPTVQCLACNPTFSTGSWSPAGEGATCKDEGLTCTTDTCKSGQCSHSLKTGHCLILGQCHTSGAVYSKNTCLTCNPTSSTSSWSNRPFGTPCLPDSTACTIDACNASGICSHTVQNDKCMISGQCYAKGDGNPTNACQLCDPTKSTTSWSARPDLTSCSGGKCVNGSCCLGCVSGGSCLSGSNDSLCGVGGISCANCTAGARFCQFGSCFSLGCKSRPGPGCSKCDCEACVCKLDPYCCSTNWDSKCVNYCRDKCNGKCF